MYPLPVQPYPSRTLDANETSLLRRFTNTLTAAVLHDYDCFANDCHGDVSEDTRHDWKLAKKQGGLAVYRDRAANASRPEDNITMVEANGRISNQEHPPPGQIQALLCIGTISGTLDDVIDLEAWTASRTRVAAAFADVIKKRQTVCRRCLRKAEESIVMQEPKPAKRVRMFSSRALSTVSTTSLDSRDWNCSDRSRVFSSRRFEGAVTSGAA
ncbi:hypothetical protein PC128_g23583 [Phytophthora cactorum]|nr:hypothetical protein PC128_g23583 [Phytophthora cactorum]